MHILAAFLIGVGFFTIYHPLAKTPENQVTVLDLERPQFGISHPVESITEIEKRRIVKQQYDYSCGSAALATLLKFHFGEQFTEQQVIWGLLKYGDVERIKERRAFSLLDMKKFVTVLGYEANGYTASIEDLASAEYWPCIVPIKFFGYRHFVVVKGIHRGHVFVADPWRGHSSYTVPQFKNIWFKNVMFIVSDKDSRPLGNLALIRDDLRFIDEEITRFALFEQDKVERQLDIQRELNQSSGDTLYFKN
ncbi:C39 family peptidase [Desulfoluna butyratoxydans]|uniref:Peptidase c39 bacteriocin processing n=1 Tax=Desulfoluna butyratoxydans TaxID=231438 RepID=A0A4V6ILJ0_9BACT|nr:C39 family peptidase [Desulfoluna butyratoxydans]VFQ45238.1 peptidase c39 bacteriocin processing [Desulfoluna butyratoxydans]